MNLVINNANLTSIKSNHVLHCLYIGCTFSSKVKEKCTLSDGNKLNSPNTHGNNDCADLEFHRGHGLCCLDLGLGLFPIDFRISRLKCPLKNEKGLALSKMKFQA